jgi:hypothetical protein
LDVYKKGQYYNYGQFRLNTSGDAGDGIVLGEQQISTAELASAAAAGDGGFF